MAPTDKDADRLVITVPEAGYLLGISRATAYVLASQGRIPVIKLGKRLVVPKAGLERMLDEAITKQRQNIDNDQPPSLD